MSNQACTCIYRNPHQQRKDSCLTCFVDACEDGSAPATVTCHVRTGHGIQFLPQYSFMPQTKKLRISQKHLMRAIFMQIWQLEVIFDSWLKNKYIIWQAWNYISMQLWFRPVLIGINRFCSLRELQTNDCECWYARWVLHRDYRYMQNPLNFGAWTICQHLYILIDQIVSNEWIPRYTLRLYRGTVPVQLYACPTSA